MILRNIGGTGEEECGNWLLLIIIDENMFLLELLTDRKNEQMKTGACMAKEN